MKAQKIGGNFARPYHSYERGLNEHTNGLIRQFLPKKLDFKNVSHQKKVEKTLNNRPRKELNFVTPIEVIMASCLVPQNYALRI
jgi:IS30 family transposase